MAVYLKEFERHTQYDNYINGSGAILPNVSICTTEGDVHYNPYVEPVETRVVAKYNVTSTSNPTQICYNNAVSQFSTIEIDGIEQPSIVSSYTFNTTGEHTVKYTLTDPTIIGEMAFYRCYKLTSVTIPNSVISIGTNAFTQCRSLTSIDIPNSVTSIGWSAFDGCSGLISIDIPNSVTTIGTQAFENCTSLIRLNSNVDGVFNLPSSVTNIRYGAFRGCSGLTSIDIPNSVTSINQYTFEGCISLISIIIPNSVISIGQYAFQNCSSLTNIVCNATTAPTISNNTFQDVKTDGTLTVPSGSTGYDVWMGTGDYYLGKYNWTKVEQ